MRIRVTPGHVVGAVLGMGAIGVAAGALIGFQRIQRDLNQARELSRDMENQLSSLRSEKEKLSQERDKASADAVSFMAINTKLQEAKDSLQKKLMDTQTALLDQKADLERLQETIVGLEKTGPGTVDAIKKERGDLEGKIRALEERIKKDRGTFHYNIGVVYLKSRMNREALASFLESLKLFPDNPEAQYNAALLYQSVMNAPQKAREHFLRYLELKPDANDKPEVERILAAIDKSLDPAVSKQPSVP